MSDNENVFRSVKRINFLHKAIDQMGLSLMHFGASEMNELQVVEKYKNLSRGSIYNRACSELKESQQFWKVACIACPLKTECCKDKADKKSAKEKIFWSICQDPKTRRRFADRLKRMEELYNDSECPYTCERLCDSKRLPRKEA